MTEARHISDCLPAWLMREVERVRAAAADTAPREFEGGSTLPGDAIDPPIAQAIEGMASNEKLVAGKEGDPGRPVVGSVRVVNEPSPQAMRPVLRTIIGGKGLRSGNRPTGFPSPALRNPLLSVIEGGRHAAPRSITL